ncbi:hypothetical protein GC163_00045 [bacterium]|nr:hypothetical protein [bacterium]
MSVAWILPLCLITQMPGATASPPVPRPVPNAQQRAHLQAAVDHLEAAGWQDWAAALRTQAQLAPRDQSATLRAAPPTRIQVEVIEMATVPGVSQAEMMPRILESLRPSAPGQMPQPAEVSTLLVLPTEQWQRTLAIWQSRNLARPVSLPEITVADGQRQTTAGAVPGPVPVKISVEAQPFRLNDELCRLQFIVEQEASRPGMSQGAAPSKRRLQSTIELSRSESLITAWAADDGCPVTQLVVIHWQP